jgi:hypothetical protein
MRFRSLPGALALAALLLSCSDDPSAAPPDDGKYRPPGNGQRTTEALACQALVDSHSQTLLTLGCAGTSRTCPSFLRAEFGADCLEYDKGSVDGCVAYYESKTTCADLATALDACVITDFEGSAPAGCP